MHRPGPFQQVQSRTLCHAGARLRRRRTGFNFWSLPMSALFSPTALVVPFENLRMSDVEVVGGKNASLGEMISQLPGGVRVPTGFATTAHAFRQFLAHAGPRPADQRAAGRAGHRGRARAGCGRSRDPCLGRGPAFSGRSGAGDPPGLQALVRGQRAGQLRSALFGDGRGPARRVVCRAAGNLSQRGGHRVGAAQDEGGVRVALQRPRDQLPGAQGLRPFGCRAFGRRAAHGAQRPRRGGRRCSPSIPSRVSRTWCSSPRATGWAKPWCRAR